MGNRKLWAWANEATPFFSNCQPVHLPGSSNLQVFNVHFSTHTLIKFSISQPRDDSTSQLLNFSTLQLPNLPRFICSTFQLLHFPTFQLLGFSTLSSVQLFNCSTSQFIHYSTLHLFSFSISQFFPRIEGSHQSKKVRAIFSCIKKCLPSLFLSMVPSYVEKTVFKKYEFND